MRELTGPAHGRSRAISTPLPGRHRLPASCDTLVALGTASVAGATVFAKNSDRPPGECQPLVLIERASHPASSRARCQYIEVPQVSETARVLGSKPVWLWGFEHGVNEHGVAIGNETIFTREAPASIGLLGMDLVRLGLERAKSAEEALAILTELIETHGQGGSGFREFEFPYNNSFLLADPHGAYILEAAGREWAARRCRATDSISNQVTIATDWDRLSERASSHARERGLPVREPFDFAATYRDVENVPGALSEGRLRQSRGRLAAAHGAVTIATMREILRDHDASGRRFHPGATPDQEQFFTICMHEGPSRTTASLIVELPAARRAPILAWASFGRPCASVFFPVFLGGRLPAELTQGSDAPSDALWWVFERIAPFVEQTPELADEIRATLDPLEASLADQGSSAREKLQDLSGAEAESFATEVMERAATRVSREARALLTRLSRRGTSPPPSRANQ